MDLQATVTPAGVVRVAYIDTERPAGSVRGAVRMVTPGQPPQTLTAPGTLARELHIATDGSGETTVAWTRYVRNRTGGEVLTRAVGARTGPIRRVSDACERAYGLSLAVAPAGDAVLAWTAGRAVRAVTRPAR